MAGRRTDGEPDAGLAVSHHQDPYLGRTGSGPETDGPHSTKYHHNSRSVEGRAPDCEDRPGGGGGGLPYMV